MEHDNNLEELREYLNSMIGSEWDSTQLNRIDMDLRQSYELESWREYLDRVLKPEWKPLLLEADPSHTSGFLCLNPHDSAMDWILTHHHAALFVMLRTNPNERAVDVCLQHKLDFAALSNPNPRMVDACRLASMSTRVHDETVYMNSHDQRVDWLLTEPFYNEMCGNANERMVDRIFAELDHITNVEFLSMNANNRVVDWLLAHPDQISNYYLSQNQNPRVGDFLLAHPERIHKNAIWANPCIFRNDVPIPTGCVLK
jgi:hypothetical protein